MAKAKKKQTSGEKSAHVVWTDADDAKLVATLRKAKNEGLQADGGWKPVVWNHCVTALNPEDSVGARKTADKIADHWGKSVSS